MSEKRKAVITILGLAGGKIEKADKKILAKSFKSKHNYYFQDDEKNIKLYTNTLPLLIDKYTDEYEIVPMFTEEAKLVQSKILMEDEDKKDSLTIFNDNFFIKDENNFDDLLKLIDKTMNIYDKVIIDVTHGFRHMPILVTINLIMINIKDIRKIEHIWFAKEIIKAEKGVTGKYEIIDLKEYLDLANLSFIITNFKDNFTISSNIKISNRKYKPLIDGMNQFSRDIMALSMNNLFFNTYPKLKEAIENIEGDFLLKDDLNRLKEELTIFEHNGKKRYKIYYNLAKVLNKKTYLLQAVSLISEAKGFYIKSAMKHINTDTKKYFEDIENKILKGNNNLTYYHLNQECKKLYSRNYNNLLKIIINSSIQDKVTESLTYDEKFKDYIWKDLRNKLVHANSDEEIENVKEEISTDISSFNTYCILDNILNLKPI